MNETDIDCRSVNDLIGGEDRCNFLLNNTKCLSEDSVIDYMYMAFCTIDSTSYYKQIIVSAIIFLFFFISLGMTADDFLCPSLLVISKKLKISQNVAGVTLLAFGNGSPDIFSSIAGIGKSRPELVIGELFGAGIFVTTIVVGSIFITSDFTAMRRPILRDMIFYVFACYFAWATVWHGSISFFHALTFILIYLVYLFTVIIGRFVNQKLKKKKKQNVDIDKSSNGFQCSKSFEKKTNKISHQHPVLAVKQFSPTSTTDFNCNTVNNVDQYNSDLRNVLISNSSDNHKFGIDNPALGIQIEYLTLSFHVNYMQSKEKLNLKSNDKLNLKI